MTQPETTVQKQLDSLTRSHTGFVLYRLPWTDEPNLILQENGETETVGSLEELNGKKGWLMAPFRETASHPAVLIRPDRMAHGWEAIASALEDLDRQHPECFRAKDSDSPVPTNTREAAEKAAYQEAFGRFMRPLEEKTFSKLVLSRCSTCSLTPGFSPLETFVKAANSYPRMMVSLCHTAQSGTWIGSTPEIILSGRDTQWHTVALAGTMPMQGETMPTEWSDKNKDEQELVSEYIRRTVKRLGNKLTEKGPYTARAGQLVHLKTDFHFMLKDTLHLGDVLAELHPTPAVCGLPKQEAYDFITGWEGYDRSYYAGIIGWLDPQGDTSLYVNLRCMNLSGNAATLYAGGGILLSSTAETEWEETQQKMNTMRNIL